MTPQEIENLTAASHDVVARGEEWYKKLQEKIEGGYPRGHLVAIDVATGQYVVGKDQSEIHDLIKKQFPTHALCYVRGVVDVCPDVHFWGCPGWGVKDARTT